MALRLRLLLAASSLMLASYAACAQEAAAVASAASAGLESVIVTARYRPEDAQQVPLSLSVVKLRWPWAGSASTRSTSP